jgi:integrase
MASVERREREGKITWRAHWRDPDGKQRNRSFERKIDAQRFLTGVEQSKLVGSYIDPGRAMVTVGALADQWLAGKVNLKATTRARYASALEVHVRPRWGSVPLARVLHGDIQSWLAGLAASGQAGASVRKAYGVLSAVLGLAVKDRRLPSNPAEGVDLPRVVERGKKYLTAVQVEQLADAAASLPTNRPRRATDSAFAQYRLVVLVLAYCGLRWSEVAALRVGRVDLMRRRLDLAEAVTEVDGARLVWGTPKSHEARSVPLPRFLVEDLARHVAGKAAGDLVFTSPDGEVMRNRNARRAWFDRAAAAIGEPGLTPHEMRHTAASLAVSAGANVKAVQRMLGHASAAMTLDIYADLFDDDLDAVADRLDAVRAAGVARLLPDAEIVDLSAARREAEGQ